MLSVDEGSELAEYLDDLLANCRSRAMWEFEIEHRLQYDFGHGHIARQIRCGIDNAVCGLGCDPVARDVGRFLRERFG